MAPSISSASGSNVTGSNVTFTCTGAGTKVRNKPFFFADWQEGSIAGHSSLSFTPALTSAQNRAIVSDGTNKRWGTGYVVKSDWTRDGTAGGRSAVLEVDVTTMAASSKLFIAGWRKWVNGDSSGNWKWWRIWPAAGAGSYPDTYIGDDDISTSDNRLWALENGTPITGTNRTYFAYPVPTSTWQLDEIRLQLNSSAGTADGKLEVRVNNSQLQSETAFAFDFSSIPGPIRKVDFQDTRANADPGASMVAYCDTFYVDDSWGRVYIGNNSTFSSCTHLELQPFSNWSDTSVTINVRLGSFSSTTGLYYFLVDNSNTVSSSFALSSVGGGAAAPTVSSVSTSSGPAAGSTAVTITGTGFSSVSGVTFGGTAATSVVTASSTSVTCVTPAHAAGAVDIVVTNGDAQTGTLTSGFTFVAAPTITSITPTSGGESGGTLITATCTGLSTTLTGVTLGGTACTSVTRVSATSFTCLVPAKVAGTYTLVVTNSDGQTGTLSSAYTYSAPPVAPSVTSCTPSHGPQGGGTLLTIIGTDFTATGLIVSIDGNVAISVTFVSTTSLTCVAPTHVPGTVNVAVTNSYNLTGTLINGFTYDTATTAAGRRRTLAVGRGIRI